MRKNFAIAVLCAGTAIVAGCNKRTPAGQVAATVNGNEVTLQEINTELQAANLPANLDKQQVQRGLLQQVIERKLLIQAARDKGIDKTPDFLAQQRRADELMLAQAYAKQQLGAVPVPSAADIDKYMREHANVFGGREQLLIEQIRFPRPQNPQTLQAFKDDHTLDAVAARLTKLNIKYERGKTAIDSGAVPTATMDQINKLPAGEPFVAPTPQGITVNVVEGRRPVAIDESKARPAAAAAWRQQKFAELLKSQIDALKSNAKIQYQNGFGPPADAAAPKAGAAPAAKPATASAAG